MTDTPDNRPSMAPPALVESVGAGLNAFTLALYEAIPKKGNTVLSPFSVGAALSLVELGAKGDSAKALHELLGVGSADSLRTGLPALARQLEGGGAPVNSGLGRAIHPHHLTVSNSLWVAQNYELLPSFVAAAREHYHALTTAIDVSKPGEVASKVNAWVHEATNEKISEIVDPQSIDDLTRLILVNAVHFIGSWRQSFSKEATRLAPFHINGEETTVDVPTMGLAETLNVAGTSDVILVQLPYCSTDEDAAMVMTIVVPKKLGGLEDVESTLSPELLEDWFQGLRRFQFVDFSLPRWNAKTTVELTHVLPEMGIAELFSEKADLSGISTEGGLQLSGVMHKTYINVDEAGTEAAAATSVMMCLGMPPSNPPVIQADRPFLYFIRDTKSGAIIFIGRVTDPR